MTSVFVLFSNFILHFGWYEIYSFFSVALDIIICPPLITRGAFIDWGAFRLLRNGTEFRILRGKMYEGTSTEQKAKNAKSGLDSMSKPL